MGRSRAPVGACTRRQAWRSMIRLLLSDATSQKGQQGRPLGPRWCTGAAVWGARGGRCSPAALLEAPLWVEGPGRGRGVVAGPSRGRQEKAGPEGSPVSVP